MAKLALVCVPCWRFVISVHCMCHVHAVTQQRVRFGRQLYAFHTTRRQGTHHELQPK